MEDTLGGGTRPCQGDRTIRQIFCDVFDRLCGAIEGWQASSPVIESGGLYTRRQVLRNLSITDRTLDRWCQAGLRSWSQGSKQSYFRGQDILEFMSCERDLPPPYESPFAEKNKQRRK